MAGIAAIPGTPAILAQALQQSSTVLQVVPEGQSLLEAHMGIDWQNWDKVSPSMLDSKFMATNFGLGAQLDTYL